MASVYLHRRIQRLIEFRDLHATVPVPIRQLVQDEGWHLLFHSRIHPLYGFAVVRGHHKVMVVSADIAHSAQRYVMAHEYAHDFNGDTGSLHLCGEWSWAHQQQEIHADQLAADLLVPEWAVEEYHEVDQIAAACEVPTGLVEIRMGDV